MLGVRKIEVIMRVRVRLHLNACVSRRMCESWQLCQRWALVLFDALLLFQFISCAFLFLSCIPFCISSFSSLLHPLLTFLLLPSSPSFPSPPLPFYFPQVPGTSGDRRFWWWSTATTGVFPLHHKPAACQQNMYRR